MASTINVKIAPLPRGEYSSSATYAKLDVVSYNGSSYMAIKAVPTGTVPTNTTYWQLLVDNSVTDGAVTTAKLADGAVTDAKLAQSGGILETVDAVVDSEMVSVGTTYTDSSLEWTTGVLHSNGNIYTGGTYDTYHYTFFDVVPGDVVTTANHIRDVCCFYNGSRVNGGTDSGDPTFTVPNGVDRIGITRSASYKDDITITSQVEKFYINEEALSKELPDMARDAVADGEGVVSPRTTTFFYISGNLIDPSTIVEGEYVNNVYGTFNSDQASQRTGYVPVDANATYCIRFPNDADISPIRYAWYKDDYTFISGVYANLGTLGYLVTAPANASYIALSANIVFTGMMIKKSDTKVEYEAYDYAYVMPKYIVSDQVSDAIINLPSKIYALSGYELNIYFENLVEDWTKYKWDVSCAKGMQLARGFRVTPTDDDEGTYSLTITRQSGDKTKSVTTSLVIVPSTAGSGESKKVMILGDSTTNNGIAVTKLNANFADDVMSITTIGTRGTSPNNHEGRSGWKFSSYFAPPNAGDIAAGVENPWYNPTSETFDASYYFAQTSIAKPDWFIINLGINDVFNYLNDASLETQIDSCKTLCDSMISSMKSASPSTQIGVCLTIPPNHSQDAFGKAYNCGQTRDRYKRNNLLWVNALIEEYEGRESEGIYVIPIYVNLDTVYNMGLESIPVNARNSMTYESPIANGGVHPVESGYWQIADVYTAFIKGNA